MKKLFGAVLLLGVGLGLAGCIKSNNSYEELRPVSPGIMIHNYTQQQNGMAMQAANIGLRMGMLLAEADVQQPGVEISVAALNALTYKNVNVKEQLLGRSATISQTGDAYQIAYTGQEQLSSGYMPQGTFTVDTGGALLAETSADAPWRITAVDLTLNTQESRILWNGGLTELFANGDGSYSIRVSGIDLSISQVNRHSSWSGLFVLTPEDSSLAYSLCTGKNFRMKGSVGGPSLFSFDNGLSATELSYRLTDGVYYLGGRAISGTQECSLSGFGDYDMSAYPSASVKVVWTFDEASRKITETITYNGSVYTVTL